MSAVWPLAVWQHRSSRFGSRDWREAKDGVQHPQFARRNQYRFLARAQTMHYVYDRPAQTYSGVIRRPFGLRRVPRQFAEVLARALTHHTVLLRTASQST